MHSLLALHAPDLTGALFPPIIAPSLFGTTLQSLRAAAGDAMRRMSRKRRARQYAFHHERVLGTSLELQVVATDAAIATRAERNVLTEVGRLSDILSSYSTDSELSHWLTRRNVRFPVSSELAEVLDVAEQWRVTTHGAFNPAAVSLVELLRDDHKLPTAHSDSLTAPANAITSRAEAITARLQAMDTPLWTVDRALGLASLHTRLAVSLDALAKGFIVDCAAACARELPGVTDVLVNIGGDLRHIGERAVAVAVTDPHAPAENAPPIAVVRIRNAALATSGGYRRGFVMNGARVSHIIDPHTGRSARQIASASVFAPDCATADALSTAFSVMTPSASIALADSIDGVGCLLVEQDGSMTTNDAWDAAAVANVPLHVRPISTFTLSRLSP